MGLLLICPYCQTKLSLTCRSCRSCGADLRDLPTKDRRYFIGEPEAPETATSPPEISTAPWPDTLEPEKLTSTPESVETQPGAMLPESAYLDHRDVSLCEALDRILNKGAVLFGEVLISVADIDLIYLGLQVILSSVETARELKPSLGGAQLRPNVFVKGAYR